MAWIVPAEADAIPRFAARTGMECGQCHVNPTGGGPRTRYARNVFERQYLPIDWEDGPQIGADTEIGYGDGEFSAAIGADVRLAYFQTFPDNPTPINQGLDTFFLMQADLYVTAELTDYVTVALDKGQTNMEVYGMVHTAERDAWLKFGHFVMPYGLRFANHRVFVREETGFNPAGDYRGLDTGIEAGARVMGFELIAAVANGKTPGATGQFDSDESKALYANLIYRLGGAGLKVRLGLSGYTNFAGRQIITEEGDEFELVQDNRLEIRQAGTYAALGLGRLSYIGEFDVIDTVEFETDPESLEGSTTGTTSYVHFHELGVVPFQGLNVHGFFEFRDPDTDTDADEPTISRVGAGFELYPLPMLEWKLLYRHTFADGRDTDGLEEVLTYVHFFF